ncbi:unnamed protein product [Urochloa decumbens]|uniref:No apical meristem-associated C-terminal domain-containing protein n=1 Tax=Urochloa decumbens TaxID=240449 RepID=A0ABC9EA73_9POAL
MAGRKAAPAPPPSVPAPPSSLLGTREDEIQSWVGLVQSNIGSSELDADEINFGALPEEQAIAEVSPSLKIGNNNKKRTKNFCEKEDILLASAWLEISMDPVQSVDQTHGTYWQRIHEYYHNHKTFYSDRNTSSLSHRWGVIQASVSKFCSWYGQVLRSNQSGVTEQDRIQQACVMYKDHDKDKRSFGLLHCWNLLQHAPKWKDLPCNNTNSSSKKQKTSSNATPGTNESRHAEEEDGPSHTSPMKGRPDGQKKEKERRGKTPSSNGETLYMDAMENLWLKREKADELKELKKKERNDERLAVETKRLELKQQVETRKIELMEQVENRRLDLQQEELELKRRMDDEKIMNMDLSGMSVLQQKFYSGLQEEIIARRYSNM